MCKYSQKCLREKNTYTSTYTHNTTYKFPEFYYTFSSFTILDNLKIIFVYDTRVKSYFLLNFF